MEFVNGKHLVNYLLKIFKNNGTDIPKENLENIRDLENIFTFMTNLPNDIKDNIDFSGGYYPWIILSQSNKYQKLSDISKVSNENIVKFTNNPTIISFDTVFKSFELGIEYNLSYLRSRPDEGDIYYPHRFEILEGSPRFVKWTIAYYTKPNIPKEENIGCYFIYDNDGELVYVGKSNSNLYERSCTSAQERTKGNFSKIELYSMPTQADTNIYEMYFIAKYNPKFNSDSRCIDNPTFELPKLKPKYTLERIGTEPFDVEQIDVRQKYIASTDYWKEPEKYYLQIGEKYNWEAFYKFHSQNKEGIINVNEFRARVQELQSEGYATFVFNNKNSCFRQFT